MYSYCGKHAQRKASLNQWGFIIVYIRKMINRIQAKMAQNAIVHVSKSNVIRPLLWLIGLSLPPLGVVSVFSPPWVGIFMAILIVCFSTLFIYSYCYCLKNNPSLLNERKLSNT